MQTVYLVKSGSPAQALLADWPFPELLPVCLPLAQVGVLHGPAILQPVMLLPGQEYAHLCELAPAGSRVGQPLLASPADASQLAAILGAAYPPGRYLLLGHGAANRAPYDALARALCALGRDDLCVCTRDDMPSFSPDAHITLLPLLMTAGAASAARAHAAWRRAARSAGAHLSIEQRALCDLPAVRQWLYARIRALCDT